MLTCPLCEYQAQQNGFCYRCFDDIMKIKKIENYCIHCGECIITQKKLCETCRKSNPTVDQLWISYDYQKPLQNLIHLWKFGQNIQLSYHLQNLMLLNPPPWIKNYSIHSVIAMPLNKANYHKRLFNQSNELATAITKKYHLSLLSNHHIIKTNKLDQHHLNKKNRMINIKNSFKLFRSFHHQNCLIIDDVLTTGATIKELSKQLKLHGAKNIYAWLLSH